MTAIKIGPMGGQMVDDRNQDWAHGGQMADDRNQDWDHGGGKWLMTAIKIGPMGGANG